MDKLGFVSFKKENGKFLGFLSMEGAISSENDLEAMLQKATLIYEQYTLKMGSIIFEIIAMRRSRKPISARKIWELGQLIFKLKDELEKLSLQLDGVYAHLSRDLGVKRKWLEKVIIFRRYIPKKTLIPKSLNWGRCEKGTRKVAQRLSKGLPLD